jgi:hypothetical protein
MKNYEFSRWGVKQVIFLEGQGQKKSPQQVEGTNFLLRTRGILLVFQRNGSGFTVWFFNRNQFFKDKVFSQVFGFSNFFQDSDFLFRNYILKNKEVD